MVFPFIKTPSTSKIYTLSLHDALPISSSRKLRACASSSSQWCRMSYAARCMRSEEHTSELQSHSEIVWRLLLEKKEVIRQNLPPVRHQVVAYDYGIKENILRRLRQNGFSVTVVPAATTAEAVLALNPDGVFLSNGPGDPAALPYAHEALRGLLGKKPIFGICLGHQVLGLAVGGKTFKLKFGHRGGNQPV